jgi:hypothetical protein
MTSNIKSRDEPFELPPLWSDLFGPLALTALDWRDEKPAS